MLPGEIKPFVQNYKINLYDYHEHKDFSHFKTENRMLLELLSLSDNKEKVKKIMEQKEYNFCEDREVAKAIFGILGIEGSVKKYYDKKQGGYDMCKGMREWAEELREEGMEKGIEQGIEEGFKQGIEKGMEQGIEEGLKQGMEKGMEQGMEKGIEKGFTSSIKALLEKGYMKKEISNLLDLDMEYVTRLMEGIVVKKVN